jgi:3-oxoacyl-[acyl-carrier protein] reductase
MDLGLRGKVALVTGAGSQIGYGKGIALVLAKEGCSVIVNDINLKEAEQTMTEMKTSGLESMAVKADIANSVEVNEMIKTALKRFGRVDILVNNAGICSPFKPFHETTENEWDPIISTNLRGVLNCTKAVLDQMVMRKSGKIINISSAVAKTGGMNSAVYGATKAGIAAFTKGLAAELAALGINVNSVAPGMGITGITHKDPPEFLEEVKNNVPVKKFTTPQDVGNMVAFLASDISSDITGQIISVDGGITMY